MPIEFGEVWPRSVHNEFSIVSAGDSLDSEFLLECTPIFAGSLTGDLYKRNEHSQERHHPTDQHIASFAVSVTGVFYFGDGGEIPVESDLILLTGQIFFTWISPPGPHYLVVSYDAYYEGSDFEVIQKPRWQEEGF